MKLRQQDKDQLGYIRTPTMMKKSGNLKDVVVEFSLQELLYIFQ